MGCDVEVFTYRLSVNPWRSTVSLKNQYLLQGTWEAADEQSMTVDDVSEIAAVLATGGICPIQLSCVGAFYTLFGLIAKDQWHDGYLIEYAACIKGVVGVPIMVVGGMRDLKMMEDVITNRKGDMISMCRPFIREPDLINHWLWGNTSPPQCDSCDGCLRATERREEVRCTVTTRAGGSPKKRA